MSAKRRVLVAGVGNVLQGDDGFGVKVAQRLAEHADLPPGVTVIEVGIGGMGLVQELFEGYDVLIVADAVDRGGEPGTVYLLEAAVPNLTELPFEQREDYLADMHLATPSKVFVMAKALGVLPPSVYILGCQPAVTDDLILGLSEAVERAVERSVERLLEEIHRLAGVPVASTAVTGE
jgi:hydrogenase maturation protease